MKRETIQSSIEIEDDDDDFLIQLAEAEAAALSDFNSNKRRRDMSPPTVHGAKAVKTEKEKEKEEEGVYVAALRGSKSLTWQQQNSLLNTTSLTTKPRATNPIHGGATDFNSSEPLIPEKNCPCGLGICIVFTANTERNQGRKFYRCPVRQENGGCGFFEWCDNATGTVTRNTASNSGFPVLPCPCGAGSCLILTAKTGKNVGQQFYKCPLDQGSSCGYFKWCNDNAVAANASNTFNSTSDSFNKTNIPKTGSSCFKCGNEGHWARDCPSASLPNATNSPVKYGGKTASSTSTCYKCNQPGHWANNCPSASLSNSASPADFGGRPAPSGTCYKCNKPGHWARNCTFT